MRFQKEQKWSEGVYTFDFKKSKRVCKLDQPGIALPQKMQFVDFIAEYEKHFLFLEIKNLSHPKQTERERKKNSNKFNDSLGYIKNELVPKCRDSYTYLHLMEEDKKPIYFAVYIPSDFLSNFDSVLKIVFNDNLSSAIRKESTEPWKRKYISGCCLFDENDLNEEFQIEVIRTEN